MKIHSLLRLTDRHIIACDVLITEWLRSSSAIWLYKTDHNQIGSVPVTRGLGEMSSQASANRVAWHIQENVVKDEHPEEHGMSCRRPNHPLCIIKSAIYDYFEHNYPGTFRTFDDRNPVVTLNAVSVGHPSSFQLLRILIQGLLSSFVSLFL